MSTKRVIDHTADNDRAAVWGGGARVTVREVIRALQVLPGDYKLWLDFEEEGHIATAPLWTVDVDHETQEVNFG